MNWADISSVFDRLERGQSVCLGSHAPEVPPPEPGPWLGLLSSGTTGAPRRVWHRWTELRAETARTGWTGWSWATPYRPDSFAGVQVALQAWASGGRCVPLAESAVPRAPRNREAEGSSPDRDQDCGNEAGNVVRWDLIWARVNEERPDALCCTPTFLELLCLSEPPRSAEAKLQGVRQTEWCPRQVTLGGEPIRARTAEVALRRFVEARFTLVYASADVGVVAKSRSLDGWYPLQELHDRWDAWRLEGGVLEVRRAGTWRSTGDRVEVAQDRFRVIGRASRVANVGGSKVSLAEVEQVAAEVSGVLQATAHAMANPVTGEMIVLRFSEGVGVNPELLQARLEEHVRQRLPKPAWPRRWERVNPGLGPNAKGFL